MSSATVVNGTYIVPNGFPIAFRPDQLDKLGYAGAITLAWPTIIGGFALIFGTRNWRQVCGSGTVARVCLSPEMLMIFNAFFICVIYATTRAVFVYAS